MYLLFTTFTFILIDQYGFSTGEAGLAYLGDEVEWGNSLLGFVSVAFIPFSLTLEKYGEAIRSSPRFQIEL